MAYKGKFRPSIPKKYRGDYTNIIYRSLWELKFMKYCDSNQNILECCPGPSTDGSGTPGADPDGIPPIPNTTIQRLRELAGLKNKN